jgi:hypothetical protein
MREGYERFIRDKSYAWQQNGVCKVCLLYGIYIYTYIYIYIHNINKWYIYYIHISVSDERKE